VVAPGDIEDPGTACQLGGSTTVSVLGIRESLEIQKAAFKSPKVIQHQIKRDSIDVRLSYFYFHHG
jgi:hypothetical protein